VLEKSECLLAWQRRSITEKTVLSERMSELPDEDLIRLASLSAQAMHLAGIVVGLESQTYLSLAAACNCELVIRRARVGMS
jgi:hypothetical protein